MGNCEVFLFDNFLIIYLFSSLLSKRYLTWSRYFLTLSYGAWLNVRRLQRDWKCVTDAFYWAPFKPRPRTDGRYIEPALRICKLICFDMCQRALDILSIYSLKIDDFSSLLNWIASRVIFTYLASFLTCTGCARKCPNLFFARTLSNIYQTW